MLPIANLPPSPPNLQMLDDLPLPPLPGEPIAIPKTGTIKLNFFSRKWTLESPFKNSPFRMDSESYNFCLRILEKEKTKCEELKPLLEDTQKNIKYLQVGISQLQFVFSLTELINQQKVEEESEKAKPKKEKPAFRATRQPVPTPVSFQPHFLGPLPVLQLPAPIPFPLPKLPIEKRKGLIPSLKPTVFRELENRLALKRKSPDDSDNQDKVDAATSEEPKQKRARLNENLNFENNGIAPAEDDDSVN